MRATIDTDSCIACEHCVDTCPQIFEMQDGHSSVKVDPIPPDQEDCVSLAADNCPGEAIGVEE